MISVADAERIIARHAKDLPAGFCPLQQAHGRVLRENIRADRDQPSFDKSTMDGIAVFWAAFNTGVRIFPVDGTAAAGDKPLVLKNKIHCVRVMTGAVVPRGCDCVIPVEQMTFQSNKAVLKQGIVLKKGQYIRPKGADARKGALVLKKGMRLLPAHIGTAASVGKTKLKVVARPRVAVIATGDELVNIGKAIAPYQTRLSNSYALRALFEQDGLCQACMFHFPDDPEKILKGLRGILKSFDIIVLTGGISAGEFDYVPGVLARMKVKKIFHKVAQKPGKPFWFGRTLDHKPVFALPGNPVSTLVCAYRYVLPYIYRACGIETPRKYAALKGQMNWKTDLTCFVPVKIKGQDAYPADCGGSGDFASLGRADGFIQYEHGKKQTLWPYFSWRP